MVTDTISCKTEYKISLSKSPITNRYTINKRSNTFKMLTYANTSILS